MSKRLGFGADVPPSAIDGHTEILRHVRSEDLLKFGLIPEFVGRFPILTTLVDLDVPALIRVLTEPRNALVKQYQPLFEIEGVELQFTESALKAVARRAALMKTGARALRTILEEVMLDLMYDIPAMAGVKSVVITEEVIAGIGQPQIVTGTPTPPARARSRRRTHPFYGNPSPLANGRLQLRWSPRRPADRTVPAARLFQLNRRAQASRCGAPSSPASPTARYRETASPPMPRDR